MGAKVRCNASPLDGSSPQWGRLCVDQYQRYSGSGGPGTDYLEPLGKVQYSDEKGCPGINNDFVVLSTQHINGANIVFGRLTHNVSVDPRAFALMAFLSTGRKILDVGVSAGTLLSQCSTSRAELPCSINTHHATENASTPIEYGLFKTRSSPKVSGTPSLRALLAAGIRC